MCFFDLRFDVRLSGHVWPWALVIFGHGLWSCLVMGSGHVWALAEVIESRFEMWLWSCLVIG